MVGNVKHHDFADMERAFAKRDRLE